MKRPTPLVDYASSEDEDELISAEPLAPPPPKKRRLPTLASTLVPDTPKDNPALHQGRTRSRPHIEGQYAAYVYVPIKLTTASSLYALLRKAIEHAKTIVPIIHPISVSIDSDADSQRPDDERELHISLTRPIYLRAHQRKEFELAIRNIAKSHSRFQASFATFSELTNDERTRTFLTAEIGAGHLELKALCDAVTPVLRTYRQSEFYSEPRFHASIAWALLQGPAPSTNAGTTAAMPEADEAVDDEVSTSSSCAVTDKVEGDKSIAQEQEPVFPTIPHFPPDLVSVLETEFGSAMRTRAVGLFDCEYLCVRIGKDVTKWRLSNLYGL